MPGARRATRTAEHEIRIDAPPEVVFPYFTDPARMVRWMGTEATLDPRPGGACRVSFRRDVGEAVMAGRYLEVVPNRRVVFSWGFEPELWGVPPATTRVEVSLAAEGDGTLVRLVHTELPEEAVDPHRAGWSHYLERLGLVAGGGDAGSDAWIAPGLSASGTSGEAA